MFKTSTKVHGTPLTVLGYACSDKSEVLVEADGSYKVIVKVCDLKDEMPEGLPMMDQLLAPAEMGKKVAPPSEHSLENPPVVKETPPKKEPKVIAPSAPKQPAPPRHVPDDPQGVVLQPPVSEKPEAPKPPAKVEKTEPAKSPEPTTNMPKHKLPDSMGRGRPSGRQLIYIDPATSKPKLSTEGEVFAIAKASPTGADIKVTVPIPKGQKPEPWVSAGAYFTKRLAEKSA